MISEFQALSEKIDRLAEMTLSLRRENAVLRQANVVLRVENDAYQDLVAQAQSRVTALLKKLPAADATTMTIPDDEAAP